MIFEILLLVAALSVDSLAASVSYGLAKIKIGFTRSLLISIICSMFLVFSAAFAGVIGAYIDEGITKTVSFLILFLIGIIKLMEKDKSERPETLSASCFLRYPCRWTVLRRDLVRDLRRRTIYGLWAPRRVLLHSLRCFWVI